MSESNVGGPVDDETPPKGIKGKIFAHPDDEGKSYAGASASDDMGADGSPNKTRKMKDYDIYRKKNGKSKRND